jgi:MOSC domain-containing protein YiiM
MRLLSVNVGRAAPLFLRDGRGKQVLSGIDKSPISTLSDPRPVEVTQLGLAGDEQADRRVHGGRFKAVCAYPFEHYPVWETIRAQALGREETLPHGFFGENLTLAGVDETEIWVGDVMKVGSVALRVVSPRQPCFKFNVRMGFGHAAKMMIQSGYTGFYLEVLTPGTLQAGDSFTLRGGERLIRLDEMHRRSTGGEQYELW